MDGTSLAACMHYYLKTTSLGAFVAEASKNNLDPFGTSLAVAGNLDMY